MFYTFSLKSGTWLDKRQWCTLHRCHHYHNTL